MNNSAQGIQDYQNARTLEIMEGDKVFFIIDNYLECGRNACIGDYIQADCTGALNWVGNLVETLSDKSPEILFIEGLNKYAKNSLKNSLAEIAKNCNINLQVLVNAMLIRGKNFRNIERYLNNKPVTLDEFEGLFYIEGKFSRAELERWEHYIYLASLFLEREVAEL